MKDEYGAVSVDRTDKGKKLGLTHLPPQSPNSGGLQSSSPQSWGARGAKKAELRKS
jgi:hypothetical protein